MENIYNFSEILKGYEGKKFWFSGGGIDEEVILSNIDGDYLFFRDQEGNAYSLFWHGGLWRNKKSECMIFPSSENRDWRTWLNSRIDSKLISGEILYSPLYGKVTFFGKIKNTLCFYIPDINGELFTDFSGHSLDTNEMVVFPSKENRDWSKYKTALKTIQDLVKSEKLQTGEIIFSKDGGLSWDARFRDELSIKSATSLIQIRQLIDIGYGGNITQEEWENSQIQKYHIDLEYGGEFVVERFWKTRTHIAFHTFEEASEFLRYPENVQLLKDYYMI